MFVFGPMLSYFGARYMAMNELAPEDQQDPELVQATMERTLKIRRESDAWMFPVGGGLLFSGAIGLMLVWVTRPEVSGPVERATNIKQEAEE